MTVLRDVDPRSADLDAWHAVATASLLDARPDDPPPPVEEIRAGALAGLPERDPSELVRLVLAERDGVAVGALRVELPLRDNTHLVWAEAHVLPASRRQGVGTALLDHAHAETLACGRTLLSTDLDEPPALVDRSPGRAFLLVHGFTCALTEVRRDLALPVPDDRLAQLERQARRHAADYDVVVWTDRCPDALVDHRAELGRVMSVDVPLGELDWQEEAWDVDRVREREALLAEQGRSSTVAAAVHRPTGALVGYTELAVRRADPALVEQWDTLVVTAHRGHRLGLLVKLAALRRLQAEHPGARRVATTNATTNGPMIAVNEALGFVVNGVDTSWQRRVSGSRAPTGSRPGR